MEFRSLAASLVFVIIAVFAFIGVANNLETAYGGTVVNDDLNRTQTSIVGLQEEFIGAAESTGDTVTPASGQGDTDTERSTLRRAINAFGSLGEIMGIGKAMITDTAVLIGLPADSFVTELVSWLFIFIFAITLAFILASVVRSIF